MAHIQKIITNKDSQVPENYNSLVGSYLKQAFD